jgi:hypothetical protein
MSVCRPKIIMDDPAKCVPTKTAIPFVSIRTKHAGPSFLDPPVRLDWTQLYQWHEKIVEFWCLRPKNAR